MHSAMAFIKSGGTLKRTSECPMITLVTLAFCLHLEVAQVGISWNFLQENA